MNEANFVSRVSSFVTGDSFLAERELPLAAVRATSGLPLGVVASATVDASSTSTAEPVSITRTTPSLVAGGISFADGETAILQFMIPQDYDAAGDRAALRLVEAPSADSSDTTDLGITSAQTILRDGAAFITSGGAAVAEDATASTGRLVRENVLDISGRGFKPGDIVSLTLDANGSGATEIVLSGLALVYGSAMRAFNDDDNDRVLGA